jgi:putative addiction module component (TIGR02574 family)
MAQSLSDVAISQLSVAERLDLISVLWDSIPDSLEELPIPEWHREELERRLAAADANPDAIPWEEGRQHLRRHWKPSAKQLQAWRSR